MSFDCEPDVRCQRGLHFVYRPHASVDLDTLADALERTAPGQVLRHEQRMGAVRLILLVTPFRVELRLGEREGEISLIHRVSASPEVRAQSTAWLEAALRSS